jgi:hypothetical protein
MEGSMQYCVPVVYRGQDNFIVEADSPEEAKTKAEAAFKNGDEPDVCGNEWEEVEKIGEPEAA